MNDRWRRKLAARSPGNRLRPIFLSVATGSAKKSLEWTFVSMGKLTLFFSSCNCLEEYVTRSEVALSINRKAVKDDDTTNIIFPNLS